MTGFLRPSTLTASKRQPLIARCSACQLYKGCQSPKMEVYGSGRRKVLVVGEAPGKEEDEKGRPFIGKAGQRLRKTLQKIAVNLDDCWTTNALICRPPDNAKPSKEQIGHCRPNIIRDIQELQPEVIILLGNAAIESVIGWLWKPDVGGIGKWCGWDIPCQQLNAWICPTWHPSFVMREEEKDRPDPVVPMFFEQHLRAAFSHDRRPYVTVPDYNKCVRIELNANRAADWIMGMGIVAKPVAIDLENNPLKPDADHAYVRCCAVSNGTHAVAFPWHGKAIRAMEGLIRSDVPKIAANLKHEHRWCQKVFGRQVKNWAWDTMLAAHVLDNRPGTKGLDFLSFAVLGLGTHKAGMGQYLKGTGGNGKNRIEEIELRQLLEYCAKDALTEWHIAKKQADQLGVKGLFP